MSVDTSRYSLAIEQCLVFKQSVGITVLLGLTRHDGGMRWEMLFADLESRLDSESRIERDGIVAELTRAEAATLTLVDRLRTVQGVELVLQLSPGRDLQGELREVHQDWVLMRVGGRETIVVASAIESWVGLGGAAAPRPAGPVRPPSLFGLAHALRGVARDRGVVVVATRSREHVGRINRVGRDHLDLVPEPVRGWGSPSLHRGPGLLETGGAVRTIGFEALVSIAAAAPG